MKTRVAETEHGAIEYEVDECDSCGNEFLAGEGVSYSIGDREGVACPFCYENGPISLPAKTLDEMVGRIERSATDAPFPYVLLFGWILIPIGVMVFVTRASKTQEGDAYAEGLTLATVYLVLIVALMLVIL